MNELDKKLIQTVERYRASGIEHQVDYEKFFLYSIITHSTAVEGSTVTEVENQLLFDEGISPAGRTVVEQLMNLDLKDAYRSWLDEIKKLSHFRTETLCDIAASVMRRTGSTYNTALGSFDSSKGELRKVNVRAGASGRSYMSFQKVPQKVLEFCAWLNNALAVCDANNIADVYRLSFAAHFRLVTIHPWVDGNGRTCRLLMNLLQAKFGVPMSKIINTQKAEYIQSLIDARENKDENIFIDKAISLHIADLEKQIAVYIQDTSVTDNVTDNDFCNVTETQQRILDILVHQPGISQSKLAEIIGIHRVNINRNISQLVKSGVLTRVGSDRKGYWVINKR